MGAAVSSSSHGDGFGSLEGHSGGRIAGAGSSSMDQQAESFAAQRETNGSPSS